MQLGLQAFPGQLEFDDNDQLVLRFNSVDDSFPLQAEKPRRHPRACRFTEPVTLSVLRREMSAAMTAGTQAAQATVLQLAERFPPTELLAAYGVVQPEYWLQPDALQRFKRDLATLAKQFGVARNYTPRAAVQAQAAAAEAAAEVQAQAAASAAAAEQEAAAAQQQRSTDAAHLLEAVMAASAELKAAAAVALSADTAPQDRPAALQRYLAVQAQLDDLELQAAASRASAPRTATVASVPVPPAPAAPTAPQPVTVQPPLDVHLLELQADRWAALMQTRAPQYRDWQQRRRTAQAAGEELPCATEHLWRSLEAQHATLAGISEYHKLAELLLCQPTGSVDNERRFSSMNNIKSKLRNRLKPPHLNACLRIASSPFSYDTFPFAAAFDAWNRAVKRQV